MRSPFGPIRVDAAYNPWPPQAGPRYLRVGDQLILIDESFRPESGILGPFRLHISVGQAF
jgi:hypothetical protein